MSTLLEQDKNVLWHPYRQHKSLQPLIPIVRGEGAYLITEKGERLLDGISSWCVNLHGHTHPYIIEKAKAQLDQLEHVIFTDFTHRAGIELAERLLKAAKGPYSKVFYSDNGSTAVEVALKMTFHYHYLKRHERKRVISLKNGFHGETFGCMAVSTRGGISRPFCPYLFEVVEIDPPVPGAEEKSFKQLQALVTQEDVAAFIFEPVLQGICGKMVSHSPIALSQMIAFCRKHGVMTIADEVLTGFGRLGPLFATHFLEEKPDLMCLAKGLTGGFFPLGATFAPSFIFEAFKGEGLETAFLHGHSYTGHPVACAAAIASLDLLEGDACKNQRALIERCHRFFQTEVQGHPAFKRVDVCGTILIVEYVQEDGSYFSSLSGDLKQFFLNHNVILRPLGPVVYFMPPYCITEEELYFVYDLILQSVEFLCLAQ